MKEDLQLDTDLHLFEVFGHPPGFGEVELIDDFFAFVEFSVKFLSFPKWRPPLAGQDAPR